MTQMCLTPLSKRFAEQRLVISADTPMLHRALLKKMQLLERTLRR